MAAPLRRHGTRGASGRPTGGTGADLERALETYTGALVVVSHDRLLRRRFPGPQREMRDGRLVA